MKITGKTKIMFAMAHPVGSGRASDVLNTYFASIDKDVAVSPLDVHPDDLGTVLAAIRCLRNVVGFGVTMPHKINIVRHLDHLTERARAIGAVNFVRRNEDGTLLGDNIDGAGFIAGMLRNGIEVKGKRVLQFGAGGAGRATAFALAEAGAKEIFIFNRDVAKARALAAELKAADGSVIGRAGEEIPTGFDVIINATSLGMKPDDALPFDVELIRPDTAVCDIVVSPPLTSIVAAARERGARAIGGQPMLDEQMDLVRQLVMP
ncbi:shikimate dehydrogenase [Corticibacterium sp. UT-5YL-CI-8]|nr:shikimate dehydrogenase [Tianweitania sp. UT-5YL-CI-8]